MAEATFQLDINAAQSILTEMAAPLVEESGNAIAARANSMVGQLTSQPVDITVSQSVGIIRRGQRAIVTVRARGGNAHSNYIGHMALAKAKDAGRVS